MIAAIISSPASSSDIVVPPPRMTSSFGDVVDGCEPIPEEKLNGDRIASHTRRLSSRERRAVPVAGNNKHRAVDASGEKRIMGLAVAAG